MGSPSDDTWLGRNWKFLVVIWSQVVWAILCIIAFRTGKPMPDQPPVIVFQPAPNQFAALGVPDYSPTTGWVKDPDVIAINLDEEKTLQFRNTPAGKAVLGDEDVYLWQAIRKVNNKGPPWYPNVNQQNVGCCVGCGWKHVADICQAVQILSGVRGEWKPLSVEVIYGASRVEIGGGRISGDGSIGRWARDATMKVGVAPQAKYGSYDLTEFSPARAREFGRKGVPDDIEKVSNLHPVKSAALVKSWADAKGSLQQGYPIAVCSDQGFRMERDADGFCKPQGTWNHCMAIIGFRNGRRPGGFILNSWGDQAHTGPVWPSDAPVAGFWADADVIDGMLRQGDSFAVSELVGFPARKPPDWFVVRPARNTLAIELGARFSLTP